MKSLIPMALALSLCACGQAPQEAIAPAPAEQAAPAATSSETPAAAPVAAKGLLTVTPAAVPCTAGAGPIELQVSWDASAQAESVEVWLQDAQGESKLWIGSGPASQATTGKWMTAGSEVVLKDAKSGAELERVRVISETCPS